MFYICIQNLKKFLFSSFYTRLTAPHCKMIVLLFFVINSVTDFDAFLRFFLFWTITPNQQTDEDEIRAYYSQMTVFVYRICILNSHKLTISHIFKIFIKY